MDRSTAMANGGSSKMDAANDGIGIANGSGTSGRASSPMADDGEATTTG